jgi:CheY-like chemotaxis protein
MDKKNLLIVDDAELFLNMQQSFLSREDFVIHTAKSGTEAIDRARATHPDLILLDLYMPDMNGDAVCTELRSDPEFARTPILIVTSDQKPANLVKCVEAGCDGFVYKPFSREQLLGIVQQNLVISQRQYKRVGVELPCTITIGDEELETTLTTLSEGGAFIEMGIPVDRDATLTLSFVIPDSKYPIKTEVVVRWAASFLRMSGPLGMGVEFLEVTGGERELLKHYVDELAKQEKLADIGVD